jgi:hypothetical protein
MASGRHLRCRSLTLFSSLKLAMETDTLGRYSKLLKYALAVITLLYIGTYLVLVFVRIRYPFELEWMEGGLVDQVNRILAGKALYVRPSPEFVPFAYPPVYFYVAALASSVLGAGFLAARLVSVVSSLGCFLIIFLFVKRETGSRFSGLLASGLFAATYRLSGDWLDIARVDSLFLFLLLAALYLIRFKSSPGSYVLAGALISLSFLTKQTAMVIALPIMLYCAFLNWRRSIVLIGTVAALIGMGTLILNYIYGGWFNYYVFYIPRYHPLVRSMFVSFWTADIISVLPVAFIMAIFCIFIQLSDSPRETSLFYFSMAAGMLGGACFSRLNPDSYNNVLFPAYAAISILFGTAFSMLLRFAGEATSARRPLEIFVLLLGAIQFVSLAYNPLQLVPTREDWEAGNNLVNTLAQIKGDVFVPYHSYLPTLVGKSSFAHGAAAGDIFQSDEGAVRTVLLDEIKQTLREKRFSAIVLDGSYTTSLLEDLDKNYVMQKPVFDSQTVFWTLTGLKTRPEFIYVPQGR